MGHAYHRSPSKSYENALHPKTEKKDSTLFHHEKLSQALKINWFLQLSQIISWSNTKFSELKW